MAARKDRPAGRDRPLDNRKFTVGLQDGLAVETVYYDTGTLCVSCQVGCGAGYPFCASGRAGLIRNLSAEEMFDQVDGATGRSESTIWSGPGSTTAPTS